MAIIPLSARTPPVSGKTGAETIAKKSAEENEASVDSAGEDKVSADSLVETGESKQGAVKTADESHAYIYIALMAASLAGCAHALEKIKKNS